MVPAIQEPTAQGGTELLSRCYLQYSVKDLALAWTMTRAGSRKLRALLGGGWSSGSSWLSLKAAEEFSPGYGRSRTKRTENCQKCVDVLKRKWGMVQFCPQEIFIHHVYRFWLLPCGMRLLPCSYTACTGQPPAAKKH